MRITLLLIIALTMARLHGAERVFDFSIMPLDQPPAGFRSVVGGQGQPGNWRIVLDEVAPVLEPLSSKSAVTTRRAVLAQTAKVAIDEHFPMLIFEEETFGDFKFTTRFKLTGGAIGQMAGMVFRYQDENNYYVLLASALDKRFWFFKMVNGQRGPLIGPEMTFEKDKWYEMAVECRGSHIQCWLDGKEAIPMMTDNSFSTGRVGFWTKSDSVSYFVDAKVVYTPREILAQKVVQSAAREYSRVLDIRLFAARNAGDPLTVVGSKEESALGQPGGETEKQVMESGKAAFNRTKEAVIVTLPLRDRNGEPVGAVQVRMRTFVGETEDNAILRARPIVRRMETSVQRQSDLFQ